MNQFILLNPQYGDQVRKAWHMGEWYYSIIDVVAVIHKTDSKKARNCYHVLKSRLKKYGLDMFCIQSIKAKASDGKFYLTDFTDEAGVRFLEQWFAKNLLYQKTRVEITKSDEVKVLHPRIIKLFTKNDWIVEQHVRLKSGAIVDLIAIRDEEIYIIECKTELQRSHFYSAIGQLLCYCLEYGKNSKPLLASYEKAFTLNNLYHCISLGIEVIAIPNELVD